MNNMARTTLDLPAPLMREIKSRAALSGVSMKDFLTQLLQKTLLEPTPAEPIKTIATIPGDAEPDWMVYAGTLKGSKSLAGDPVAIQRKMRNQWLRKSA